MQNPRTRKQVKTPEPASADKLEVVAIIGLMILCALLAIVLAINFNL